MPISSLTGINAPERPPTWLEAITPPFFTASLSSASAAVVPCAAADLKPHLFEDVRHGIAHRGRGRKGEIDDAERHVQPCGSLSGDQLTHARDLERRAFDRLGHHVKRLPLRLVFQRALDHAGAGNAHVDAAVALARRRGTRPP